MTSSRSRLIATAAACTVWAAAVAVLGAHGVSGAHVVVNARGDSLKDLVAVEVRLVPAPPAR